MNTTDFSYCDERFADLQLLRYRVDGFEKLTLKQKKLVYFLSQAALYGRDILWDQNGKFNLKIRKTLEAVYTEYTGNRNDHDFQELTVYLKRIWFSNGIHHHYGCDKFPANFSETFLKEALLKINPEKLPLQAGQNAEDLWEEIAPVIFNPAIMPKRVNQADGEDLLLTSACNYYAEGITQKEAEEFYQKMKNRQQDPHPVMYGLNSQLVRKNGTICEEVWKINGMYGKAIEKIVFWLEKAVEVAENPKQQEVIQKLIEFYKTGDLRTFDEYSILWIQEQEGFIDFTNGFIETYGDPLGMKASWEGYVNLKDQAATERTQKLSENAQWFEDHSPVASQFKKENCQGVSAKVIEAAILGGDLYPASAIGINLPNSNWIRAEHGSKSVTIGNLTHAYNQAARGNGFKEEFVISHEVLELMEKYEDICDDLHTDLHECLGHGSGKLLPGVDPDSLKAYGATIEEARADLFGLYYLADDKLTELGLTPDENAYKAQYYGYLMNGLLTQLVRINPGKEIEEAHMRNRALISHWALEMGKEEQVIEIVCRNRKTYVQINNYPKLKEIFGKQLAEIQRIKSEGDLEAARILVERYGIKIDPSLHQEILARYKQLNLAPYKGFINPVYTPVVDDCNQITDIQISYGEAYDAQMLRYSKDYATL